MRKKSITCFGSPPTDILDTVLPQQTSCTNAGTKYYSTIVWSIICLYLGALSAKTTKESCSSSLLIKSRSTSLTWGCSHRGREQILEASRRPDCDWTRSWGCRVWFWLSRLRPDNIPAPLQGRSLTGGGILTIVQKRCSHPHRVSFDRVKEELMVIVKLPLRWSGFKTLMVETVGCPLPNKPGERLNPDRLLSCCSESEPDLWPSWGHVKE